MKRSTERFEIDVFKEFNLPKPTAGLVQRVVSPKGVRKVEGRGYSYSLKTDQHEPSVYKNKPMLLKAGMYEILDISNVEGALGWNHYLFIIDPDGSTYPVAEYLQCADTKWVKESLPIIKRFFSGEPIDPISVTQFKPIKRKISLGWNRV